MVQIKKRLITPEDAELYLQIDELIRKERKESNRRIRIPMVFRYANDMKSGKWKEDTAELIKISKMGCLLDGQHRLRAVIKSNTPIWFHVAEGMEDEVFDVLDTGISRNATDVFRTKGIKNESWIPSIMQMCNQLKLGRKAGMQVNMKHTNADLFEQYCKDPEYWQTVVRRSHKWYHTFGKILTPSFIGGFYSYFNTIDERIAYEFMDGLATGMNIQDNVINLLRNKLIQDKASPRKMPPTLKMALVIKSWNFYVSGTRVKQLKYSAETEDFPVAIKPITTKINY